jgi:hypothetical protein
MPKDGDNAVRKDFPDQEDFLKGAARGYADACGQSLLSEQHALERQGIRHHLPRADAKIAQIKRSRQRGRRFPVLAAAAAACLALVFVLPQLFPGHIGGELSPEGGSAYVTATAEPLRFALPSRFTLAGTDVDNGKNIYFLADTAGDNQIVLTTEKPEGEPYDPENMDTVYIDGTPVAAEVTQDYNLLMFESGGRLYTLVCKYDMGALAMLYRSITHSGSQG